MMELPIFDIYDRLQIKKWWSLIKSYRWVAIVEELSKVKNSSFFEDDDISKLNLLLAKIKNSNLHHKRHESILEAINGIESDLSILSRKAMAGHSVLDKTRGSISAKISKLESLIR